MVPFYLAAAARAGSQLRGHRSETGSLSWILATFGASRGAPAEKWPTKAWVQSGR